MKFDRAEYRSRKAWPCTCSRCGIVFLASKQTEIKARKGGNVYCTPVCLSAAISAARTTFGKQPRNCATCGTSFVATSDNKERKYCSFECYTKNPNVREATRIRTAPFLAEARKRRSIEAAEVFKCELCGVEKMRPRGKAKINRFCSQACYRLWFADRFDRWVSDPRTIGKLQGFDEFLTQETLQCLIEGCDWRGTHLGKHLNIYHGIRPEEFKRAVGFNKGTGLVPAHISKEMSERSRALGCGNPDIGVYGGTTKAIEPGVRAEGKEHYKKSSLEAWGHRAADSEFMGALSRRLSKLAKKRWAQAKEQGLKKLSNSEKR